MTHKEKAIELLSQMPEPYKTLALENLEKYPIPEPINIQDAIQLFLWEKTPQGEDFWNEVFYHYDRGQPMPDIDDANNS